MSQLATLDGLDRTGMLGRLSKLQQALVDSGTAQLAELSRKIAAGEPVVLGPATAWACPHCGFHQPDTEFANGVIWRSDPEVPMGEHLNQLHMADKTAVDENRFLHGRLDSLEEQVRFLKKKARQKRASVAPVTGRASRGRRASSKRAR